MKVVCIKNEDYPLLLTDGKIYEAKEVYTNDTLKIIGYEIPVMYQLIVDTGDSLWATTDLFKTLDETRNEKLDQIL